MVPNRLCSSWFSSSLRSSRKTFCKGWGMENVTSNMARAALQATAFHQQGCLGHHAGTKPAPLDPGSAAALSLATRLTQGAQGPCPGQQQERAEVVSLWGWGSMVTGLWAGLASCGCCGPDWPSRAGKRGGMEGPAPRGCASVFLGSGSQSLWDPLTTENKPSGLPGPLPVSLWRETQQAPNHFPGAPVGQHEKERVQAVPGWLCEDALQVSMDATYDLWHLEGMQVRMVLPLECSHFLSCCQQN